MTEQNPLDSRTQDVDVEEMISTGSLPTVKEEKFEHLVRRCWLGGYELDLMVFLTKCELDVEVNDSHGLDFRAFLYCRWSEPERVAGRTHEEGTRLYPCKTNTLMAMNC